MAKRARPSVGDDFRGVQVILHPCNARHKRAVERAIPGASVSVGPDEPMWGARVIGTTSEGHKALSWFWDAGYQSCKEVLAGMGVRQEWVEDAPVPEGWDHV